jgi:hypothetical protein
LFKNFHADTPVIPFKSLQPCHSRRFTCIAMRHVVPIGAEPITPLCP